MQLMKAGRELEDKLKKLAEQISPDTSEIQGISDRSEGLSRQVRSIMFGAGNSYTPVLQAVTVKYEKIKIQVHAFLKEFNAFYEKDVEAFKKVVTESGFSLFKTFKPIEIENKK
jgi:hypothetical protein